MKIKYRMPFVNLNKTYQRNKKDITQNILRVIQEGNFILGKNVSAFEKEFASFVGTKYAIGVASGTDALILALRALDIKPEDEVIIPVNAYPTAFAVAAAGAKIKLVDIDENTYNIDPKKIESAITSSTRVIIPVHLYGQAADLVSIMKVAKKYKLHIIEDCAQAHGAKLNGKISGSIGTIGCFSFYPTKNLGAFGDGGMVVTNNKKFAQKIKELRMYGEKERYKSMRLGINSRLDEVQAAILRIMLKKLKQNNELRKKIAKQYLKLLKNINVILPQGSLQESHVNHLFVTRVKNREKVMSYLKQHRISVAIHYPTPIHLVKAFQYLGYKKSDFPIAEKTSKEILSLPCYPGLSVSEIKIICKHLSHALAQT